MTIIFHQLCRFVSFSVPIMAEKMLKMTYDRDALPRQEITKISVIWSDWLTIRAIAETIEINYVKESAKNPKIWERKSWFLCQDLQNIQVLDQP